MKKKLTTILSLIALIFNLLLITSCEDGRNLNDSYAAPIELKENEILIDVERYHNSRFILFVTIQDTSSSIIRFENIESRNGNFVYFGKVNDYYKQKIEK